MLRNIDAVREAKNLHEFFLTKMTLNLENSRSSADFGLRNSNYFLNMLIFGGFLHSSERVQFFFAKFNQKQSFTTKKNKSEKKLSRMNVLG